MHVCRNECLKLEQAQGCGCGLPDAGRQAGSRGECRRDSALLATSQQRRRDCSICDSPQAEAEASHGCSQELSQHSPGRGCSPPPYTRTVCLQPACRRFNALYSILIVHTSVFFSILMARCGRRRSASRASCALEQGCRRRRQWRAARLLTCSPLRLSSTWYTSLNCPSPIFRSTSKHRPSPSPPKRSPARRTGIAALAFPQLPQTEAKGGMLGTGAGGGRRAEKGAQGHSSTT